MASMITKNRCTAFGRSCEECRREENEMFENYQDDPELGDENDPSYREGMFETYRAIGIKPDELTDPEYRATYVAWLKTHE
jgi:hypothetical protein